GCACSFFVARRRKPYAQELSDPSDGLANRLVKMERLAKPFSRSKAIGRWGLCREASPPLGCGPARPGTPQPARGLRAGMGRRHPIADRLRTGVATMSFLCPRGWHSVLRAGRPTNPGIRATLWCVLLGGLLAALLILPQPKRLPHTEAANLIDFVE